MATFKKKDEKMIRCPYNPVHVMKPSTYQAHLARCRKDHLDQDFKTCPYNAQHRLPAKELHIHVTSCPDRAIVDRQILSTTTDYRGTVNVPTYANNVAQPSEFWDEEPLQGPGYDPLKNLEKRQIFRDTANMKPLAKKEYYRSLFQQNGLEPSEPAASESSFRPSSSVSQHSTESRSERVPQREPDVMRDVANINLNLGMGRGLPIGSRLAARFSGSTSPVASTPVPTAERQVLGRGQGIIQFHPELINNASTSTSSQIN